MARVRCFACAGGQVAAYLVTDDATGAVVASGPGLPPRSGGAGIGRGGER